MYNKNIVYNNQKSKEGRLNIYLYYAVSFQNKEEFFKQRILSITPGIQPHLFAYTAQISILQDHFGIEQLK